MNDKIKRVISIALAIASTSIGIMESAQAQRRVPPRSSARLEALVERIENRTERFQENLEEALDRSRLDGTDREDEINEYVRDFERATNRLRERVDDERSIRADVREVVNRASRIDNFVRRFRLGGQTENDWAAVRRSINELERIYYR